MIAGLIFAALVAVSAGGVALRLARVRTVADPLVRLGLMLAAGLCVIPLLFEFVPFVRWTPIGVRLLTLALMAGWMAVVPWRRAVQSMRRRPPRWYVMTAVFLAMVIGLAVAQVHDVAVLPGIDSVHHLMLTRLIMRNGAIPHDLEPFIIHGRLVYHWGVHANVAFLALLLGRRDPFAVAQLLVTYAAFLRIVCTLTLYAACRTLFSDRLAAFMAGAIAAGYSALPAAFITQGRFTHLAGVAVLPALLSLRPAGGRSIGRSILAGVLLAGLFLIQARLIVFGIAVVIAASLFSVRRLRPVLTHLLLAAVLSGILVLPWAMRLIREPLVAAMLEGNAFAQQENRWTQRYVPPALVWLGNNDVLMSVATAGLSGVAGLGVSAAGRLSSGLWLCVVVFSIYRTTQKAKKTDRRPSRRKQERGNTSRRLPPRPIPWRPLALLLCWVLLSAVSLLARSPRIDLTAVVPYAAGALTSFIPMILMASGMVSWTLGVLFPSYRAAIAAVVVALCAVTGMAQQARYAAHSPVPEADLQALKWMARNVPAGARFVVMAHPFYGIYVGEDAGYWTEVLTDRSSLPPPMIYGWVSPVADVERTNALLRLWTTVPPESSVPGLLSAGITHAYIGSTTHPQARAIMKGSSRFRVIYDRDNVLIAQLR